MILVKINSNGINSSMEYEYSEASTFLQAVESKVREYFSIRGGGLKREGGQLVITLEDNTTYEFVLFSVINQGKLNVYMYY